MKDGLIEAPEDILVLLPRRVGFDKFLKTSTMKQRKANFTDL